MVFALGFGGGAFFFFPNRLENMAGWRVCKTSATEVSHLSQTFDLSENDLQTPKVFDLNGCLT